MLNLNPFMYGVVPEQQIEVIGEHETCVSSVFYTNKVIRQKTDNYLNVEP